MPLPESILTKLYVTIWCRYLGANELYLFPCNNTMMMEFFISFQYVRCLSNASIGLTLAPGRFEQNFREVIFKLISVTDGWGIFCKIALKWMSVDLTDDKSTLVQVMAWCLTAPSHYLSQCWPRSMSPYSVTRPQWVLKSMLLSGEPDYFGRNKISSGCDLSHYSSASLY